MPNIISQPFSKVCKNKRIFLKNNLFRDYAKRIEQTLKRDVGTFDTEILLIERRSIGDGVSKAQKR